jgi:hypothetical protein
MSTAVEVRDESPTTDEGPGTDVEVRTSMIPAPTTPASMLPASVAPTGEERYGGGCMGIPGAYSGSRAESDQNKKPYALIKLGHKLCGFVR